MAKHNELGKHGEELAVAWFKQHGYHILHRNWKYGKDELDIIALKTRKKENFAEREFLHFIEVKTRNHSPFGYPEDSVNYDKFKKLKRVAREFLYRHPNRIWVQYDILSITIYPDKDPGYFLLEDVFF